jgi:excisionase family DNA binding protein
MDEWLTVDDAAKHLGLTAKKVYHLASLNRILHYRLGPRGGKLRFQAEDLDAYIEQCATAEPPPKFFSVKSAARELGINSCRIFTVIRAGRFQPIIGRHPNGDKQYLITREDLTKLRTIFELPDV